MIIIRRGGEPASGWRGGKAQVREPGRVRPAPASAASSALLLGRGDVAGHTLRGTPSSLRDAFREGSFVFL